jgi:hypothetical protein
MSQRRRALAKELQAEADGLPEGHPKKEKLLYHADMAVHSADLHEKRERYASRALEGAPPITRRSKV